MKIAGNGFVVTGGLGGVGTGSVQGLVADGAKVVIWDRIEEGQAKKLAQGLNALAYVSVDIASEESVAAATKKTVELFQQAGVPLVGAIHCAAIVKHRKWTTRMAAAVSDFSDTLQINALGTFTVDAYLSDAIQDQHGIPKDSLPARTDKEIGVIINVASVAAKSYARTLTYGPTKTATIGITETAADYLAPVGIRVNSISPSIVDTPMMTGRLDYYLKDLNDLAAFPRRAVSLPELYSGCKYLIENEMVNGFDLRIDGIWKLVSNWADGKDRR